MKIAAKLFFYFVASLFFLTGCFEGGKLTNEMAERALKKWDNAVSSVTGVREVPQSNSAEVDFSLNDLSYNYTDGVWGKRSSKFSGTAKAEFIKYNDGRWVLSRVSFNDPKILPYNNPIRYRINNGPDTN